MRAMDLMNKIIFASRETLPKSDELDYSINTFPEQYKLANAIRFFNRKWRLFLMTPELTLNCWMILTRLFDAKLPLHGLNIAETA